MRKTELKKFVCQFVKLRATKIVQNYNEKKTRRGLHSLGNVFLNYYFELQENSFMTEIVLKYFPHSMAKFIY